MTMGRVEKRRGAAAGLEISQLSGWPGCSYTGSRTTVHGIPRQRLKTGSSCGQPGTIGARPGRTSRTMASIRSMNSTLYGVGWQGSRGKLAANWDGISSVTGWNLLVLSGRAPQGDPSATWARGCSHEGYIECVPAEELRGAETASRVVQRLLKQSACGVKSLEMSSQMPS
jgi:hypothetical protein